MATPSPTVDPARAAVERADDAVRALQQPAITDPTVFVKSAALGALTVVELSKLAQAGSKDADIRSFAARMLRDHESIRTELAAIARRAKLDVPTSLVHEDEQMLAQGAGKSGEDLDAWYVRQTITELEDATAVFGAAANLQDAQLAAFAKKTLPLLERQLKSAVTLT